MDNKPDDVNTHLTSVVGPGPFGREQSPSDEGLATERWGNVRHALYLRLLLIVAVLALAAVVLGSEPWGPI
jgi:hypothetical protein